MKLNKKTSNTTIKIFSILFAVFLWAYVMGEVNPVVTKSFSNIPVRYDYENKLVENNLELMSPLSSDVKITVSGRRNDILKLKQEDFEANIDLRGYKAGEQKIPVDVESIMGKEIIIDYSPKHILAQIDEELEKQLPIEIKYEDDLDENYSVGNIQLVPNYITVKGPSSIFNKVETAEIQLNLRGYSENLIEEKTVKLLDKLGKEVSGLIKEPSLVNVDVEVLKNKLVPVTLETIGDLNNDYYLISQNMYPRNVKILGNKQKIDSIKEIKTKAIDISKLNSNKIYETEFVLPEDIKLKENQEQLVKVEYKISKYIEKEIIIDAKNVSVLSDLKGLEIDGENSTKLYKFILRGPAYFIDSIDINDLNPSIEKTNLVEGSNQVKIMLELEEHIINLDKDKVFNIYLKKPETIPTSIIEKKDE